MDSNVTEKYTLDNFTKETGKRFRMTKKQTARVALTELSDSDRQQVAGMNIEEAAKFFDAFSANGKTLGWVEEAITIASSWTSDSSLTRQEAFEEFLASNGPQRLEDRKPDVPVSVWLDPELTLDNFETKTLAATGHKIRFRIRKDQSERGLSREAALTEIVEETRNNVSVQEN